ncbi:transcription-repair coupling factor [Candidatus Methylospira mobilis]|uniref:Transcription-repair-coupling factor n=1 Tax=Candidatus Methylospira mobilis TaxID=1808979 RepID=A0A5Q0BPN7_9GAMM|nr:transcription-repair coupling factor [Candidatus Methylospira mobilis]QFY44048.1 transcription-repair coupling factor [Candidatus Methylospira mobilis]WNV05052.1 transcription-repair coupling factor [Candidatus Methylospira mobilis]
MTASRSSHPIINPTLPGQRGDCIAWSGLHGCGDSLAIARAAQKNRQLNIVVTFDMPNLLRLEHELKFFLDGDFQVLQFPDWEILPYDIFSPLPEIVSHRLKTLALLPDTRQGVLVVTASTLMQRLAPRTHILANTFTLKRGSRFSIEATRQTLESVGYQCVSQVLEHGEFAVRGAIVDLFPMGSTLPYRIELFDEEVDSIRSFDPENQRSLDKVEAINLYPAREFPFDATAIKLFRQNWREQVSDNTRANTLYQDVSKSILPGGIECYLPLFVSHTETLFDYLPAQTTFIMHGPVLEAAGAFHEEALHRYQLRKTNLDRPALPVEKLYLDPMLLEQKLSEFQKILIGAAPPDSNIRQQVFNCPQLPNVTLDTRQKLPLHALNAFRENQADLRLLFIAETAGHREALLDTLHKYDLRPVVMEGWRAFLESDNKLALVVAPLSNGLWLPDAGMALVTETQLSGEKAQQRRRRKKTHERDLDALMRNLEELEIGSPVVHQDHGVGRYLGLQRLTVGGMEGEFLALEYANHDKLYVPVSSLHLINRYSGAGEDTAPLHRLGSETWQKAKRKAFERARDVAAELLDIYARRAAMPGHACNCLSDEYQAFAASFPFEETPDQENAILSVIEDMSAARPMDRVICGDVGFGKTEVAMRAAFIAAQNSRQVAVLVPTTLLAQQHYQNFRDRFADWPIRIAVLSRFVGGKQQTQLLEELAEGRIDIMIGTHKLLQKDIRFKNLGLAIIDEEHRFGVAQKEHLKKLRSELDFLTLTATPIPRTLNMALGGLRDISLIATPPANRHAIQTFVHEWSDSLIQEAITREIKRGGQAYFLHNKIETMEKMARELGALVPEARIRTAHGQMPERELEQIMLDFYHQRFNLLISTTIIESGIDVPSANTMLINRADQLGLAQLHQLRGRVGRSHHRAYAYLIVPPKALISTDAAKRLQAIESSGELGAGFMISTHDMEIRGCGELLGDEQSGQIQEIGFTLYSELLERAVKALKSGKQPELDAPMDAGPEIDLQSPALIPDDYLPDVHTRLVLYKRIASARDAGDLRALQIEMIDRFGLLPPATKTLFAVTELKLTAEKLGVRKIEAGASGGRMLFGSQANIDPVQVIFLIQNQSRIYRMDGPDKIRFLQAFDTVDEKIAFLKALCEMLSPKGNG